MAASDNVLRAGLTPKKVDADEVLQCVSVTAAPPLRVAPERQNPTSIAYYAPVDDSRHPFTGPGNGPNPAPSARPVPGSGPRTFPGREGGTTLGPRPGSRV